MLRLEGKNLIEDVEFLITSLHNYATTNQILINYNSEICKVARENYYPDEDGRVVFHKLQKWVDESYSVAEMLEFLEKYCELIKDVKFQAHDGSIQPLVNFAETCDVSGVTWYTHIIVGDGSLPMKMPPNNQQNLYNPNVPTLI